MITNSYVIQKREREPDEPKNLSDILGFAEKFASSKNCQVRLTIKENEKKLIDNLVFDKLENVSDDYALILFKNQNKEIKILNKYVYQNYPVLDNNPENEKKPTFFVELLRLEIIL